MNKKKIAFITCVNNENEYAESCHYISCLKIPEGYEIDLIAVREAVGMAAGYQAGMQSTDAKYKVYLHQDTFIINTSFIEDMLWIFTQDEQIGMFGCVGCEEIPLHGQAVSAWDVGCVFHNCIPNKLERRQSEDGTPVCVEALDGLLLVTQYDVNWREDLFEGWDFYDVTQCLEMKRAGYKVVVPYQEKPWCYHDNTYSKMGKYYEYCNRMINEYQDIKHFHFHGYSQLRREHDELRESSRSEMKRLVERGEKEKLRKIFENQQNRGYLHLREFEALADIEQLEAAEGSAFFWNDKDSYESILQKINVLKFALKRLEYGKCMGNELTFILENYSLYAINVIARAYFIHFELKPE